MEQQAWVWFGTGQLVSQRRGPSAFKHQRYDTFVLGITGITIEVKKLHVQGWSYLWCERFSVFCFNICTPSLSSLSHLQREIFKTKHALNLWHNKYLRPCMHRIIHLVRHNFVDVVLWSWRGMSKSNCQKIPHLRCAELSQEFFWPHKWSCTVKVVKSRAIAPVGTNLCRATCQVSDWDLSTLFFWSSAVDQPNQSSKCSGWPVGSACKHACGSRLEIDSNY